MEPLVGASTLELVQMGVKNQSVQRFAIVNTAEKTVRVLTLQALEGLQNASFVKFKEDSYFIAGGSRGGHFTDEALILDVKHEKISRMPIFPVKVSHLKLFPYDGKIYCFGGMTQAQTPIPPYAFDLKNQSYEPLQFIPYQWTEIVSVFGYKDLICLILNNGRIVCYEPRTGDWSFWKKLAYRFDFVFNHGNKLYLADTTGKTISEYDIDADTIVIKTMFDLQANELLFSPSVAQLYILQHVEGESYYWQVDLASFKFEKVEGQKYKDFFGNGVLFRNFATFTVFAGDVRRGSGRPVIERPEFKNSRNFRKTEAVKDPNSCNIFGCFEIPFEIEADLANETFAVRPISSKLTLKNSQALLKLDPNDYIFAGGKRSDFSELGEVQVQRYQSASRLATDLRELPLETDGATLVRVKDSIYFLNESINFFRYTLASNVWTKLAPNSNETFYNYFVFQDRLFIFYTKVDAQKLTTFCVEEWNPEQNSWNKYSVPEVAFRVQAQFSYKVNDNTFLMICSDNTAPPLQRLPVLYEVVFEETKLAKGGINLKLNRLVQLTDFVVPMFEVTPLVFERKLLFVFLDKEGKANKVIYDLEAKALGDHPKLSRFFDKYVEYLKGIQLDFDHLKNFKVAQ